MDNFGPLGNFGEVYVFGTLLKKELDRSCGSLRLLSPGCKFTKGDCVSEALKSQTSLSVKSCCGFCCKASLVLMDVSRYLNVVLSRTIDTHSHLVLMRISMLKSIGPFPKLLPNF